MLLEHPHEAQQLQERFYSILLYLYRCESLALAWHNAKHPPLHDHRNAYQPQLTRRIHLSKRLVHNFRAFLNNQHSVHD